MVATDGLAVTVAATVLGVPGAVLAIAAVASGEVLATGLLMALDTALDIALDTALGTAAGPVFAALPWLEQPVASVTRSVTPTTAAAAVPGVRRLTPVPS